MELLKKKKLWSRSRLKKTEEPEPPKKNPVAGARAAWKKNEEPEPEPVGKKMKSRSRSRLEKKWGAGAGAKKKLTGSSALI